MRASEVPTACPVTNADAVAFCAMGNSDVVTASVPTAPMVRPMINTINTHASLGHVCAIALLAFANAGCGAGLAGIAGGCV